MLARFLRIIVIVPGLMSGFATFAARHPDGLQFSDMMMPVLSAFRSPHMRSLVARQAGVSALPEIGRFSSAQVLAMAQTTVQNQLRTWAQDENRYDVFEDAQELSEMQQAVVALHHGIDNPRDFARMPDVIDTILGLLPEQGASHGENMALADVHSVLTHVKGQLRRHEPTRGNFANTWHPGNISQVERILSNLFGVMRGGVHARTVAESIQPEPVAVTDRIVAYREALLHAHGRDSESIFTSLINHVDRTLRERNDANVNNVLLDLQRRLCAAQSGAVGLRHAANISSHIYRYNYLLPLAAAPRYGLRSILAGGSRLAHWWRGDRAENPIVLEIIDGLLQVHNNIDSGLGALLGERVGIPAGVMARTLRGITDDLSALLRHPERDGVFREVDQTLQESAVIAEELAAQSVISPDLNNLLREMGEAWVRPITPAPITPVPMAPENSEETGDSESTDSNRVYGGIQPYEMNDQPESVAASRPTAVRDLDKAPVFRDLGNLNNDQYMPDDYVRQSEHEDDQLEEPGIVDEVAESAGAPRRTYLGQVAAYMWSFVPNFRYDDVG